MNRTIDNLRNQINNALNNFAKKYGDDTWGQPWDRLTAEEKKAKRTILDMMGDLETAEEDESHYQSAMFDQSTIGE